MNEIKQLVGILLIAFAFTMPIAFISDEIKFWLTAWGLAVLTIAIALIGFALLGVI